jgi:hypothetical protein
MKKKLSSILAALTLFAGLSSTALAEGSLQEAKAHSHELSSSIEIQAVPCDYYASGQHVLRLVGQTSVSRSSGSHSAYITNSDGSQRAVDCHITNWYDSKTYACACGNASQTVLGSFISASHQYSH